MSEHCSYCGRFVSYDADSATPFGSSTDSEPPDPEFICNPCAARAEREAIATRRLPAHWITAKWERRAAQRLGLVRAGPRMAAWGHWYEPDNVPEGYLVQPLG